MGRLLQAALLVTSAAGVASAGPTRKVKVDTSPIGATVYLETIENEPACASTPCTIDVPVGSVTLIIRLDKYEPEMQPLDVPKGKKPLAVNIKLKAAFATLTITDAPKGATVKINGEDKGKVGSGPFEVEVPAEPTTVVVTYKGKPLPLSEDTLDLNAGEAKDIQVKGAGSTTVATRDDGEGGGGGGDEDDGENPNGGGGEGSGEPHDDGGDTTPAPKGPLRPRLFELGLALDVGFRSFAFSDGSAPFTNSGEVVVGPALELWPGRFLGVTPLRNLSLFVRAQFSPLHQTVSKKNPDGSAMPIQATTFWGALEVSLRNKWTFGSIGVEPGAGFVRDQVAFSAANSMVLMQVPSADYQSLRFGARLSYVGSIEPYAAAEGRIVLSGGELANRADKASASGYHLAAGVRTHLGPLGLRGEVGLSKYSWTFTNNATGPNGASDRILWLSFLAGYDY